jgi:hypothetical protein
LTTISVRPRGGHSRDGTQFDLKLMAAADALVAPQQAANGGAYKNAY